MDPIEQNAVLGEIATILMAAAPPTWQRLVFDVMAIGKHVSIGFGVATDDGARQSVPAPRELSKPLSKLRRGMYTKGVGTWYSLAMIVDRPGRYQVRYDYDSEPPFRTPPAPEQYVLDQERFPRTPEHLPPWFQAHLSGAG